MAELLLLEFVQIDIFKHFLAGSDIARSGHFLGGQVEKINEGLQKTVLCETVQKSKNLLRSFIPWDSGVTFSLRSEYSFFSCFKG